MRAREKNTASTTLTNQSQSCDLRAMARKVLNINSEFLMLEVVSAYLFAAALVLAVLCVAILAALAASPSRRGRLPLTIRIAGMVLIAIGGLEKMGWASRPWAPGSPAQYFDDLVFRIVWLAGFGLVFAAWMMRSRMRREPSLHESHESTHHWAKPAPPKVVTIRQRPEQTIA
jgi:hypothetical protein